MTCLVISYLTTLHQLQILFSDEIYETIVELTLKVLQKRQQCLILRQPTIHAFS
jgi:hypothetical protein